MFGIRRNGNPVPNAVPNHTGDHVTYYAHTPLPWLWWPGINRDSVIPFDKYPMNTVGFEMETRLSPPTFVQRAGTLFAVQDGVVQPFGRGTVPVTMPQYPRR